MELLRGACLLTVLIGTFAEDFHLEYFATVTLDCDDTKYNFTNAEHIDNRYWLVPSGDLISTSQGSGHFEIDSNFTLTVNKISDDDFGNYFCILVRSDKNLDRIMHGVNTDGPYYGDLLKKYTDNAIIGGIAAGTLFVIVAGSCLVWQLRYQRKNQRNKAVDELDKAIDGYDLKAYDNVGIDDIELEEKNAEKTKIAEKLDDEKKM